MAMYVKLLGTRPIIAGASAVAGAIAAVGALLAWPSGPSTRADCLLNGLKGVTGDTAANAIITACYTKFPEAPKAAAQTDCVLRNLSKTELSNLEGRASISFGLLTVSLYNGNSAAKIRSVDVEVDKRRYSVSSLYSTEHGVDPFSRDDLTASVLMDRSDGYGNPVGNWEWSIIGASGCSTQPNSKEPPSGALKSALPNDWVHVTPSLGGPPSGASK